MWSAQCSCVLRVMQVQTYACAGVICVGLPTAECERLELPLMVATAENEESMYTAFTVTVDLRQGVTTGISASDRCRTIRALGSADTQASDLRKPGHIFPLIAREYGVLARPGHTEAAVDMARMAGMAIVLFCGAERHLGIHRPLGTHQQAAAHAGAQLACRRCLWSGRHNPQLEHKSFSHCCTKAWVCGKLNECQSCRCCRVPSSRCAVRSGRQKHRRDGADTPAARDGQAAQHSLRHYQGLDTSPCAT
jgi:hypothetical protein